MEPIPKKTIGDGIVALVMLIIISIPLGMLSAWTLQVIAGMYLPLLLPGTTLTFVQALAVRVLYVTLVHNNSKSDKDLDKLPYSALIGKVIRSSLAGNAMMLISAWTFWHLFVKGA